MSDKKTAWVPEIMYEEAQDGASSQIPFIMVPEKEEMPKLLYMFESRETGTFEPGAEGEEVPVIEWELHQYADMAILKENLTMIEYDNVRFALGLEPLLSAAQKGSKITQNIRDKISIDEE